MYSSVRFSKWTYIISLNSIQWLVLVIEYTFVILNTGTQFFTQFWSISVFKGLNLHCRDKSVEQKSCISIKLFSFVYCTSANRVACSSFVKCNKDFLLYVKQQPQQTDKDQTQVTPAFFSIKHNLISAVNTQKNWHTEYNLTRQLGGSPTQNLSSIFLGY